MTGSRAHALALAAIILASAGAVAEENAKPGTEVVRALLVARQDIVLSSQISGRVDRMSANEGDRFRRGQVLAAFDCAVQKAQHRKAQAELGAAERTLIAQRRLAAQKSGSELDLALAEVGVERAKGEVALMAAMLDMCEVKAPFDGRVVERRVKPFESIASGQPIIAILDDSVLEIQLIVPSQWVGFIKPGHRFTMRVDETGNEYPARIVRIGARIDAASRSVKVIGEVEGQHPDLLSGMSGSAKLAPP